MSWPHRGDESPGTAFVSAAARVAWAGFLAALVCAATSVDAGDFYLVGGELHDGTGRVQPGAVIRVKDDTIVSVSGPTARERIPEGAVVVDASGKWVTPGLVAAATRLGLVEIGAEASTRDTEREGPGPVRASYDPAPAIRSDSSLLPVQAVEGVTSAAVHPSGGLLAGQVAWMDLVYGELARELGGGVLPGPVAQSGELGRQVGASRAASLEALRRLFSDAGFLAANRGRYDRRELRELEAHALDLEALQPVIAGELPLAVYANGAGDIRSLIALAREFGIRLVIQGGAEAWRVADELAVARVPVVVTPSRNVPAALDALGARLDNAARLAAAGVPLAIAIVGGAHNVRNLTQEAGIAVANGLPWEAALTALTLGPARIYGMEERYGSVEPGKIANLVVWGGDPFEHSNWAERVFIRGREIPMVSRQTLLRDRYRDPGSRAPAR